MRYYQPKVLASISAGSMTFIYLVIILVLDRLIHPEAPLVVLWAYQLAGAGLIFIFSWFICRFILEKFIGARIRLIYKAIHKVKAPKGKEKINPTNGNVLERVGKEVEKWAAETSQEILQLKQMETYRKDFLGNVAHELRNPVFTIQGYVLTLLDGGIDDPAINREYLRRTEKTINRLITIIEDLDVITHLESGELKLNQVRFDITALAREVMDSFEMKAGKKKVSLILNDPTHPVMVKGDRERIHQVLTNLVDNGIRYRKGKHARVRISFFDMDEHFLTEVADNGIGIDQQDIPRIFDRFYRTESGRAASGKGKGLGLAIVKHLIEAHGQTLHVRSTPGVGTTVGFTLRKAG